MNKIKKIAKTSNINKKLFYLAFLLLPIFATSSLLAMTAQQESDSSEKTEHLKIVLVRYQEFMEHMESENQALEEAFDKVDLVSVFTDKILFNFQNFQKKQKEFKELLFFLDESEKRTKNIQSEFRKWVASNPKFEETIHKFFLKGIYKAIDNDTSLFRKKSYAIKKDIVSAYINLLDFISKIFGTFSRGENSTLLFSKDEDINTMKSLMFTIQKLYDEEENLIEKHLNRDINPQGENTKTKEVHKQLIEGYFNEVVKFHQAFHEIDWQNLLIIEVISNPKKVSETKKQLEAIYPLLEAMEQKWEKDFPELFHKVQLVPDISDHERQLVQNIDLTLEKRLFSIRKKYAEELIKTFTYLSNSLGNYKVINNTLKFNNDIERALIGSYKNRIAELMNEEREVQEKIDSSMQGKSLK